MEKAFTSTDPTPTFDPSKNTLQVTPSKRRMSSSAKVTPPTVPLLPSDRKSGLLDGGGVGVGVNVGVAVGVLVGVLVGVGVLVDVGV